MISDLKKLTLVAGSNVLNSGLGFLSGVLIARLLGAEAFGSLSIFVALTAIFVEMAGRGTDLATVRFAGKYLDESPRRSALYFKVMLITRIVLASIVLVVGNIFAGVLADVVFHTPGYVPIIRFATVAAVGMSFCYFILSYYQTTQQFFKFGIINILGNGFKFIPVLSLMIAGALTLNLVLFVYSLVGFAGVVAGLRWLPKGYFAVKGREKQVALDLWRFGRWMVLATFLDAAYRRVDTLMLGHFLNRRGVGIYCAALNIVFAMDLLIMSAFTVLIPKVSRLNTKEQFTAYIWQALKLSAVIAIPLSSVYWLSDTLITLFYSEAFAEATHVFRILFIGFIFSLMVQPISLLFVAKNKPEIFACIDLVLIVVLVAAHTILIPTRGIVGAAYATAAGRILQAVITIALIYVLIYRRSGRAHSQSNEA
jgi:O-antigen/teichoic acid export membrane protein